MVLVFSSVARGQEPPTPPESAATETAAAPRRTTAHAWELDVFLGYGQLAFPSQDSATLTSSVGGPGFALSVAYRGHHFTHPFVDISYVPIVSSSQLVNVPVGGTVNTVTANNSSYALGFILGPGWDIDWFRLRAGVGFYDVIVRTTVNGATNSPASLNLGFLATASAMVWRREPFAVGIEGRLVALQVPTMGISQLMWEIGVTGRWDFVNER
jgi:hypothetical protein